MGKWVFISWIGGQNTMGRGRYTMGRCVDIPWVWGSKYHGYGVDIPWGGAVTSAQDPVG
jgi:hypothetical protein